MDDHSNRIVKLENKTKTHDGLHKSERTDIDGLLASMAKLENNNTMAGALADSNMDKGSIDAILAALNDMQDKINADMAKRLDNFVKKPEFLDLDGLVQSANRRIQHSEQVVKDVSA